MTQKQVTLTTAQAALLDFMDRRGPMTDAEIVALYHEDTKAVVWATQTPSGLRTRRSELVKKGLVQMNSTQKSLSGRNTTKWEVV